MTDSECIQGLIDGNEEAARWLVDNHQLRVFNICLGFLRNKHDAEDIAQDVFVEVIRNAASFRGDAKVSTWLHRIAVNRSLNYIRSSKRRRLWLELNPFSGNSAGDAAGIPVAGGNDLLEQEDLKHGLECAIDSLPQNQRIAFTLSKLEDLSYQEIAGVMNLSLPAVESLIHRAKMNLQKRLKKFFA